MPDIAFLRIAVGKPDEDLAYTLVRNKMHTNVAFMIDETPRREPGKDTITAYRGLLGSYPNFIFVVPLADIEEFGHSLHAIENDDQFIDLVKRFGILRTHPQIWDHFNWFVDYMRRKHPIEAGIYDLNRYKTVRNLISQ